MLISPHFFECAHGLQGSNESGIYIAIIAEAVQNLQTKVLERAREGDIAIGNINLGSRRASYLASSWMQALSDSHTWVHRADGGAGYDRHGSLAWPLVSRGEEQTSLSLKNWGGGEECTC